MLLYKTRAMSSPDGKANVYFCCHPQDFEMYYHNIADEILKMQNCAVWYSENKTDTKTDEFELSQMHLFVVPITENILKTENFALDEFRFAMDHHIPVLPLLVETGVEEVFMNSEFGEIQYLTWGRGETDSDKNKMEEFLSEILVSDELIQLIREAFDAYVFISYRKKDREQALKLMHLIHENEQLRDIALWYDDFLIPGENFNSTIQNALLNSDLFVLTVTPNILEKDNYIMRKEYPLAKEAKKSILPVEMKPTDHNLLKNLYEDIPNTVHISREASLSEAIIKKLKTIAIKDNDDDPEHNFYIGLAYLKGIDVERNYARALDLIEGAAKAGMIPAVEKLVQMYTYGEGVARNLQMAIYWQEHKVFMIHELYGEYRDMEGFHFLMTAIIQLGAMYKEIGANESARTLYKSAENVVMPEGEEEEKIHQIVSCYLIDFQCAIGQSYEIEMRFDMAKKHYMEAFRYCETLDEDGERHTEITQRYVYACLIRNMIESGETDHIEDYFKRYEILCEKMIEKEGKEAYYLELASLSLSYSRYLFHQDRVEEAEKNMEKTEELIRLGDDGEDRTEIIYMMLSNYILFCVNAFQKGDFDQILSCYQKIDGLLEENPEIIEVPSAALGVASVQLFAGTACMEKIWWEEAREILNEALLLCENFLHLKACITIELCLYGQLSSVERICGNHEKSEYYTECYQNLFEKFLESKDDSPEYVTNLSSMITLTCFNGDIHFREGRIGEALNCYENAAAYSDKLIQIYDSSDIRNTREEIQRRIDLIMNYYGDERL